MIFSDAADTFIKKIDDLNIIEKGGKLDFTKSVLKNDSSGQKMIVDIYEELLDNGGKFTPKEVNIIRKKNSIRYKFICWKTRFVR